MSAGFFFIWSVVRVWERRVVGPGLSAMSMVSSTLLVGRSGHLVASVRCDSVGNEDVQSVSQRPLNSTFLSIRGIFIAP